MKIKGVSWITKTICIDVDTGEQITQEWAHKKYTLIKTNKEVEYVGKHKSTRILKLTKLYRNKQQLELGFTNSR